MCIITHNLLLMLSLMLKVDTFYLEAHIHTAEAVAGRVSKIRTNRRNRTMESKSVPFLSLDNPSADKIFIVYTRVWGLTQAGITYSGI